MAYTGAGCSGDGAVCRAGADRGTDRLRPWVKPSCRSPRRLLLWGQAKVNCVGTGVGVLHDVIAWGAKRSVWRLRRAEQRHRGAAGGGNNGGDRWQRHRRLAAAPATLAASARWHGHVQRVSRSPASLCSTGYPYAYAGEGPYAFDRSGFTKFVIQNTPASISLTTCSRRSAWVCRWARSECSQAIPGLLC